MGQPKCDLKNDLLLIESIECFWAIVNEITLESVRLFPIAKSLHITVAGKDC